MIDKNIIIQHFNDYSNCYTALATIVAFIALFASIKASNKAIRDNRQQLLVGKLEEICYLISSLATEYIMLHHAYNLLVEKEQQTFESQLLNSDKFHRDWEHAISLIDHDLFFEKMGRALVLINLYLGSKKDRFKLFQKINSDDTLKFQATGFIEIINVTLLIIKSQNLQYNSYHPNKLPSPKSVTRVGMNICIEISKKVKFAHYYNNEYEKFRKHSLMELFIKESE